MIPVLFPQEKRSRRATGVRRLKEERCFVERGGNGLSSFLRKRKRIRRSPCIPFFLHKKQKGVVPS